MWLEGRPARGCAAGSCARICHTQLYAMRMIHGGILLVAALAMIVLPAAAQDPVRLPGVSVRAAPPAPGPKLFAGIVRDTEATPLEGVEITIPELQRRVLSNADGTFRFGDMPKGTF